MSARKPAPAHTRKEVARRKRHERDAAIRERRDEIDARARSLSAELPFEASGEQPAGAAAKVGAFQMVYESQDGKFCLFEDAQGHLTAANALKFAK